MWLWMGSRIQISWNPRTCTLLHFDAAHAQLVRKLLVDGGGGDDRNDGDDGNDRDDDDHDDEKGEEEEGEEYEDQQNEQKILKELWI